MKILYLKEIGSTQLYLKELIKKKDQKSPLAVVSDIQTDGVGSRDNSWSSIKGNLFLSFSIKIDNLPNDLKLESTSIYFSYILKELLTKLGSKVWLKWPNDIYLENKKIGGMITNLVEDTLICGVGLNLVDNLNSFSKLDIKIDRDYLVEEYLKTIQKMVSWKHIFSKYELEFVNNNKFFTHNESLTISLKDVELQNDGSILYNGERIYSRR